ncbi:hypothetical protein Ngar_c27870 [Candidatus Nitrososphaera gargensis Ga9.2]|uniref:Integrase family protein n=1 Tax=Nitrososphaera gargensis (strain Ga9.2) TaxID=1237085 RepID=K0IKE4_NITGG|nr:hypothetical protein [Candidatus Nitrososphaera gargensis]AFU59708.1 hypothetical protein Ngar_c27870 [Candidatus Nitrososphaera gargensis Ga9.2]
MSTLQFEQHIDLWAKHREKITSSILRILSQRPHTIPELAKKLDLSYTATFEWLTRMNQIEVVYEDKAAWIGLRDHRYNIDYESPDIDSIPAYCFYNIHLIHDWYRYAQTRGQKDDLRTFKNLCYGKVVPTFKINPVYWRHPETTKQFRDSYEKRFKAPFKPHIRDAVRTFLQLCLGVRLTKYDSAILGLKVVAPNEGKYRYLKLTKDEFDKAERWLESDECKQLCEQQGIRHSALLCHWAIAISSFGRPSSVLALETRAIENHGFLNRTALHFMLQESKQQKIFPKYVMEEKLVKWAESYWKFRLEDTRQGWRYLFITDLKELPDTRKKYSAIYKALFRHLDKKEPVWHEDSLYCIRHIGIQRWIMVHGFAAIPMLQVMGFPIDKTLFMHYAGLAPQDFLKAASSLNFQQLVT